MLVYQYVLLSLQSLRDKSRFISSPRYLCVCMSLFKNAVNYKDYCIYLNARQLISKMTPQIKHIYQRKIYLSKSKATP